ncbi:uncharacterized protein LOC126456124 [Schistocerca serialis cubense]|uniref:uncharacterized protein LOC126456124 n=1 Tax=Schistocerca serialis cubense TaxID=2023355 RepID=UPI00214F464A|nr:uncharacterized protein LOC126456124 [Schistocerca serialis cubense]
MSTSIEEQSHPRWINSDFLQAALKQEEPPGEDIIESISVENACPEGSGYISRIFRVAVCTRVKGTSERAERRLIVKCSADEGLVKAEADKAGVFRVKSLALGSVMPEVHRLLAAVEGSAFRPLAARCLRCGDLPADFLVLEDLAAEGFVMAEAGRPPDCEHCAAVLKAYARLHAASASVLKDRADCRERLRVDPLASVRDYMLLLTGGTFRALADQLRAYPEYSKYADGYLQIREDTVDRVLEERSNKDVHLLVMLHGDCWMNNIMFKYDAGEVVDLRFVDFQLSTTGSPAVDVQHFLYGSASEEVHRRQLADLLTLFHGELQSTLRALGLAAEADAYPLDEFLEDMERTAPVGLLYSTFNVVFLSSGPLASEINKFLNNNKYSGQLFAKAYANPYSLSFLKYLERHQQGANFFGTLLTWMTFIYLKAFK